MLIVFVWFWLTGSTTESDVAVSLENIAVLAGRTAIMNCSIPKNSEGPLRWVRINTGKEWEKENVVYAGQKLTKWFDNSSFRIERRNNHTVNLIIDPVELSHAGRYGCQDGVGDTNATTLELIVLASPPNCTQSYDTMSCSVLFSGNWPPVMEWRNEVNGVEVTDGSYSETIRNKSLTSTLVVRLNLTENTMRDSQYTCTTKFTKSLKPLETDATNLPGYHHSSVFNLTVTPNWTSVHPASGDEQREDATGVLVFVCVAVLFGIAVAVGMCVKCQRMRNSNQPIRKPDVAEVYTQTVLGPEHSVNIAGVDSIEEIEMSHQTSCDDQERQQVPQNLERNSEFTGKDGTVYVQVNKSGNRKNTNNKEQKPKPKTKDEYAFIDHMKRRYGAKKSNTVIDSETDK